MASVSSAIVTSILEALRGAFRQPSDELMFAGRLLAWVHVSNRLVPELAMPKDLDGLDQRELFVRWAGIGRENGSQVIGLAFEGAADARASGLSDRALQDALRAALSILLVERKERRAIARWIVAQANRLAATEGSWLEPPPEVAEFGVALLHADRGTPVIVPGNSTNSLAVAAMEAELKPTVVSPIKPELAAISAVLTDCDLKYHQLDSFSVPLETTRLPHSWAAGLINPPWGRRGESLGPRFETNTGEGQGVELGLRYVEGRCVVMATQSLLLATTKPERDLRERLVRSGRLEAVIQFPGGLMRGTQIPFVMIVLRAKDAVGATADATADISGVTFCRVPDSHVHAAKGKLRHAGREFRGADVVLGQLAKPDNLNSVRRSADEIARCEYVLAPSMYLDSASSFFLEREHELVRLDNLVDVIKPQHVPDLQEIGQLVREVGPGDLSSDELTVTVARVREVSEVALKSKAEQVLRESDVLVSVKGSVGKIAVVGPQEPNALPLLPSLSFAILRPKGGLIDPRFLALYLKSPAVKKRIESLVTGTTIPNISLHTLRALPVWSPSLKVQAKWVAAYEEQSRISGEINALIAAKDRVVRDLWSECGLLGRASDEPIQ